MKSRVLSNIAPLAFAAFLASQPLTAATPPSPEGPPPLARVEMVVDSSFGVRVEDPYRWMEEPGSPELKDWLRVQAASTRRKLDAIPERPAFLRRTLELTADVARPYAFQRRGASLFYERLDPARPLPRLFVRSGKGRERLLVDPATLQNDDKGAGIDIYTASPDGAFVAFNLASGGSEISRIHIMDTASGARRPDVIEHVWSEFAANWAPDGAGFFYTQMAPEVFQDSTLDPVQGMRVRFHKLGSPPADDPVWLGPGVSSAMPIDPREFPVIELPPGSSWAIATASGARSSLRIAVARIDEMDGKGTRWQRVADYDDDVQGYVFADSCLYLLSSKDASNRRILRLPLFHPVLGSATVAVPESRLVLTEVVAARDGLYVTALDRGAHVLYRLSYDGKWEEVPLPVAGTIMAPLATLDQDGVFFSLMGWAFPHTYYHWDPVSHQLTDLKLCRRPKVDTSSIRVERAEVPSFDGTLVPLWILYKEGLKLDGRNPAILSAYGSYGMTTTPSFGLLRMAWLERGGVWTYAGVRGGGDNGQAWYLAGKGPNKPNGIRDFIACAEYLERKGYTGPAHLGVNGGSMGGVLVGPAIVQRPDLFRAAVLSAAILNPVRYLHGGNGANQSDELGSPETGDGLRSLLAMDATQSVRENGKYPAVMLSLGLNDNRVPLWHSGKFGARLLAAGSPVFIRTDPELGHAGSTTRKQGDEWTADYYSFLWSHLSGGSGRPEKGEGNTTVP